MPRVYIDTSALAKWYINEAHSQNVEDYLRKACPVHISLLTMVEMKSLTARRVCRGDFDPATQAKILATLDGDVARGHLALLPHTGESFHLAEALLGAHPEIPLRTLDAMHLGVVRSAGISAVATADMVMLRAVEALGLECEFFG